jgi:hypothetical protein
MRPVIDASSKNAAIARRGHASVHPAPENESDDGLRPARSDVMIGA